MRHAPALLVALLLTAQGARAQGEWEPGRRTTSDVGDGVQGPDSLADGVYGRFDGDLALGLGLGVEQDAGDSRGAARISAHYFSSIGLYAGYGQALSDTESDALRSTLSVGVDLRPAFVPRWATNREQGPGVLDLTLDSISLGVGAYWGTPTDLDFGDERGFELSGGLGLPLMGKAPGLWLESRALGRFADGARGDEGARFSVLVLLSWHAYVLSPLASNAP